MEIQYWIDHADSLFHQIFMIVMGGLQGLAYITGTTYNEVNIFVYYVLIPASWIWLISLKTSRWINLISVILLFTFLLMPLAGYSHDFAFQKSVDFLNWTAAIFNSNYIDMSVYICVAVVGIIYLILIPLTLPKKLSKIILIVTGILFVLYMVLIYPNFKTLLLKALEMGNVGGRISI